MHVDYLPSESLVTVTGAKASLHPSPYLLAHRMKLKQVVNVRIQND